MCVWSALIANTWCAGLCFAGWRERHRWLRAHACLLAALILFTCAVFGALAGDASIVERALGDGAALEDRAWAALACSAARDADAAGVSFGAGARADLLRGGAGVRPPATPPTRPRPPRRGRSGALY